MPVLILLFFAIPIGSIAVFVSSIRRYRLAKEIAKSDPENYSKKRLFGEKITMIFSGIVAVVLTTVVVGFAVLLGLSIAFM